MTRIWAINFQLLNLPSSGWLCEMERIPEASRKENKDQTAPFQHFITSDLGGLLQETKTTKEKVILNSFRKEKRSWPACQEGRQAG